MKELLRFIDLLLMSLLVGTMFGIWLGCNPSQLSAATYVEQQQNSIRALNDVLPAMGALCILLTIVLAAVSTEDSRTRWMLVGAVIFLIASAVITRFENQPINRVVMTWAPAFPPKEWQQLRDIWWNWHILRTATGMAALALSLGSTVLPPRDIPISPTAEVKT